MARVRYFLDTPKGQLELAPGTYVLGRADDCDVVIQSGRASRQHARIVVTETEALLEDLGSANGTFVNGAQVFAPRGLVDGDFVVIGDLALDVSVQSVPDTAPPRARAPMESAAGHEPRRIPSTTRVNTAEVLVAVAEQAILHGNPEVAERALETWLSRVIDEQSEGRPVTDDVRDAALLGALLLVRELGSQRWVDCALELHAAFRVPMAPTALEQLDAAIARSGASPDSLARYELVLRALPASSDATETLRHLQSWRGS